MDNEEFKSELVLVEDTLIASTSSSSASSSSSSSSRGSGSGGRAKALQLWNQQVRLASESIEEGVALARADPNKENLRNLQGALQFLVSNGASPPSSVPSSTSLSLSSMGSTSASSLTSSSTSTSSSSSSASDRYASSARDRRAATSTSSAATLPPGGVGGTLMALSQLTQSGEVASVGLETFISIRCSTSRNARTFLLVLPSFSVPDAQAVKLAKVAQEARVPIFTPAWIVDCAITQSVVDHNKLAEFVWTPVAQQQQQQQHQRK